MKRRPEQPHGEPAALLFGALLELAPEGPPPREACCGCAVGIVSQYRKSSPSRAPYVQRFVG